MNNKRYQHILFDLDGTLTDPMIGITSSVKYALSYFNTGQPHQNSSKKYIIAK